MSNKSAQNSEKMRQKTNNTGVRTGHFHKNVKKKLINALFSHGKLYETGP
jgi:hypothetical protein